MDRNSHLAMSTSNNEKGGLKKMLMSIFRFSSKTCGHRLSSDVKSPVFVSSHRPITELLRNDNDRKQKHVNGKKTAMVLRNEGTAVVITTSNPYAEFRSSVLMMMVENDICSKCSSRLELEHLMRCYLAVNSLHHHPIIIQVFYDVVCEDLCAHNPMQQCNNANTG